MGKSKHKSKSDRKASINEQEERRRMQESILKIFHERAQSQDGAVLVQDKPTCKSSKAKSLNEARYSRHYKEQRSADNSSSSGSENDNEADTRKRKRRRKVITGQESRKHGNKTNVTQHAKTAHNCCYKDSEKTTGSTSKQMQDIGGRIARSRLTKGIGLFNPGKKSKAVYREALNVPESVERDVEKTLKEILTKDDDRSHGALGTALADSSSVRDVHGRDFHEDHDVNMTPGSAKHDHDSRGKASIYSLSSTSDNSESATLLSKGNSSVDLNQHFPKAVPYHETASAMLTVLDKQSKKLFKGRDLLTETCNELKKLLQQNQCTPESHSTDKHLTGLGTAANSSVRRSLLHSFSSVTPGLTSTNTGQKRPHSSDISSGLHCHNSESTSRDILSQIRLHSSQSPPRSTQSRLALRSSNLESTQSRSTFQPSHLEATHSRSTFQPLHLESAHSRSTFQPSHLEATHSRSTFQPSHLESVQSRSAFQPAHIESARSRSTLGPQQLESTQTRSSRQAPQLDLLPDTKHFTGDTFQGRDFLPFFLPFASGQQGNPISLSKAFSPEKPHRMPLVSTSEGHRNSDSSIHGSLFEQLPNTLWRREENVHSREESRAPKESRFGRGGDCDTDKHLQPGIVDGSVGLMSDSAMELLRQNDFMSRVNAMFGENEAEPTPQITLPRRHDAWPLRASGRFKEDNSSCREDQQMTVSRGSHFNRNYSAQATTTQEGYVDSNSDSFWNSVMGPSYVEPSSKPGKQASEVRRQEAEQTDVCSGDAYFRSQFSVPDITFGVRGRKDPAASYATQITRKRYHNEDETNLELSTDRPSDVLDQLDALPLDIFQDDHKRERPISCEEDDDFLCGRGDWHWKKSKYFLPPLKKPSLDTPSPPHKLSPQKWL